VISGVGDLNRRDLEIYPNPAGDVIHLHGDFSETISAVKIYDSNGREIPVAGYGASETDVHDLSSGVYFVHMITRNGHFVGKFVKR
jgi:hypothetical protein